MRFHASFLSSFASVTTLPAEGLPEVALIGRSNVGKSSLINALTERKQLAKTSSTPGKTQLLNYFLINEAFFLVDMPGYGYAKESREKRVEWARVAEAYFTARKELVAIGLLIDARHPLLESDRMVLEWFHAEGLPFFVVLTKTDKAKQEEVARHAKLLKRYLAELVAPAGAESEDPAAEAPALPAIYRTSSEKGTGIADLRRAIAGMAVGTAP